VTTTRTVVEYQLTRDLRISVPLNGDPWVLETVPLGQDGHVSSEPGTRVVKSAETTEIMRILHGEQGLFPSPEHVLRWKSLTGKLVLNLQEHTAAGMLSSSQRKTEAERVANAIRTTLSGPEFREDWVLDHLVPSLRWLNQLNGPIHVLPKEVDRKLSVEQTRGQIEFLRAIREAADPTTGLITSQTVHSRATKTGRVSVRSGIQWPLLKKSHRKTIVNMNPSPGWIVVDIDLISLEPRVLLASAPKTKDLPKDIYQFCQEELRIGGMISRDSVKLLTVACINGAGPALIKQITSLSTSKARTLMDRMKGFFGIDNLQARLESERAGHGDKLFFTGHGFPVFSDGDPGYVMVNNFIQGTAAEVALHMFRRLTEELSPEVFQPMIVIHDGLLGLVRIDSLSEVTHKIAEIERSIPGFPDTVFYTHVSTLR
jgi:hypothetical protein